MKPIPFSQVRRKDRAVSDEAWIREQLHRAPVGVIATAENDQPYAHPNLFVFDEDENALYLHSAREGRTWSAIKRNARVCFTVSEMGRLLPADAAFGMSVEYASVVVFGRAAVVTDAAQAERALERFLAKYLPHLKYGEDYAAIAPAELARTAVYCIQIEEWSAKRKQAAEDFPGAYRYPHAQGEA